MPRLTEQKDIMFSVEEYSVFASIGKGSNQKQLVIPFKKAIVNTKNNRVLGVVGQNYKLVSNEKALEWAFQCCQTVFPETKKLEWQVCATDAPHTGSYCFIDLMHNTNALDFKFVQAEDKPDTYSPFIRVTNSYNGLRALTFDIGFFRKVCKNGLILPQTIIRFKFNHLRLDIPETIAFDFDNDKLSKSKQEFSNYLKSLLDCNVDSDQFSPFLKGVLKISKPKNLDSNSKMIQDWLGLESHLIQLREKYEKELGKNAYAVLNAITEFASQPIVNRCIHRDRHSYQRLAGVWLSEFTNECNTPGFNLKHYIENLNK